MKRVKRPSLLDLRQTQNYAYFLKLQNWNTERINNTNYFIKKFPLIGSVLKIQRPQNLDFNTIKELQKKYRVFQTIIEPDLAFSNRRFKFNHSSLLRKKYKLSKYTYLPSKTLVLDLTQDSDTIFRKFTKESRRSIRKGSSTKVKEYSSSKEIKKFYYAWKKYVNFSRHVPSLKTLLNLKKSFPHNKSLLLASHNISGRIIGGAIFTISSHDVSNYITYYMYGFTNDEGRTSLSQYSLLYSGILWGKKMGCKQFDFEGVYDDRFPIKSWLGFTHFKKQFGGSEVLYPGCYTKLRFPI